MEGIDIEALAREIAVRLDPDAWWDSKDVGAFLKCQPRTVTEQYVLLTDFPKATRFATPEGKKGHPRWPRREIVAWSKKQRDGLPGRPRKN